jgi:hypothetical protein
MDGRKAKAIPAMVRFWRLVNKSPEPGGCWEFAGAKVGPKGHRKFTRSTGISVLAHRFSWELAFGPPGGQCVLHRCDASQDRRGGVS